MNIIPIFIPHLGCPNDCVFCNQREIASPYVPNAEDVENNIITALEYTQNPEIAYYGGSFTAIDRNRMIEYLSVAAKFVKMGKCSGIRVSTRPDAIDEEILEILKEYQVKTIEIGAQSMVDEVLLASKRGHNAQDVRNAARLIKAKGFNLGLQIMTGLPLDDEEKSLYSTLQMALEKPDFVRIYPVCVIEHTALAHMWREGKYQPLTVEQAVVIAAKMCKIFENHGIKVIRVGLNPTEELSQGGVIGGAYHPALGEMVRSKMMNLEVRECLKDIECKNITININPKDMSIFRGQKNKEFNDLCRDYKNIIISIGENENLKRGTFEISINN